MPNDRMDAWYALISTIKQLITQPLQNHLFNRKSHFGNPNTVCDRISKEAVRELKLKEESNYAISHINQYRCRESANYYLGYNANRVQESIKRLASGKRLTSPVQDPGNLAVSMKLSASLNRLAGAMNNAQNGISFLEVQDGMLETVGKIIDRMSELKGLSSQDPMKSEMDSFSYNNEFKDLQIQLYAITNEQFNGVSLFANHTYESAVNKTSHEVLFNRMDQSRTRSHHQHPYQPEWIRWIKSKYS